MKSLAKPPPQPHTLRAAGAVCSQTEFRSPGQIIRKSRICAKSAANRGKPPRPAEALREIRLLQTIFDFTFECCLRQLSEGKYANKPMPDKSTGGAFVQ